MSKRLSPPTIVVAAVALLFAGTPSSAAFVEPSPGTPPARAPNPDNPYAAFVTEASRRFEVPESWIRAVMRRESNSDPHATSHRGATGLMQVMPQTWDELRTHHRLGPDAYDPRDSILAGAAYLREMHDRYSTVEGMLAAYNAGPERYDDHLATGRPLPGETQAYVAAIAPSISGTAPTKSPGAQVARAFDLLAAPLFVARVADQSERTVQTIGLFTAAFTADEAHFIAMQSAVFTSPGISSQRQMAADRSVTVAQPERATDATEQRRVPDSGSLFVPRSQPEPRP